MGLIISKITPRYDKLIKDKHVYPSNQDKSNEQ